MSLGFLLSFGAHGTFAVLPFTSPRRTGVWVGGSFAIMVATHWAASLRRHGSVNAALICFISLFSLCYMKFVDGFDGAFEYSVVD